MHFFNYPRHPQSNAHLERFNRTIQEQFAQLNTHLLDEPSVFNRQLMRYNGLTRSEVWRIVLADGYYTGNTQAHLIQEY